MAWVGLNRLIKLTECYNWQDAPLNKFKETAFNLKNAIEELGYNKELNAYTHELNGDKLDASLLTFPLVGYCKATSPRMVSTIKLIQERLTENSLLYRYRDLEDGLNGKEGAFGICNFWLIENLAKTGEIEKAMTLFDTIVKGAGPTGLLTEEIAPASYALLGNYPQGFTHIGLMNAAYAIDQAYQKIPVNYANL